MSILKVAVKKRFPNTSADENTTVGELVQEILQSHATGIHFRERNAGKQIDAHMTDQGKRDRQRGRERREVEGEDRGRGKKEICRTRTSLCIYLSYFLSSSLLRIQSRCLSQ